MRRTTNQRLLAVAGYDPDRIASAAREMMRRPKSWGNPFGDGQAGRRIVEAASRA